MFTTTHDAILLAFAAMWATSYIVHAVAFSSGRIDRVPGVPLYIAIALVITAILW